MLDVGHLVFATGFRQWFSPLGFATGFWSENGRTGEVGRLRGYNR